MDHEFEYHWKKNSGPPSEKDKLNNHLIDYVLRFMKSYGSIIKTYHLVDNLGAWTEEEQQNMEETVLYQDFLPFLTYTKNKKKRWLLEDGIGPDMISSLQKTNDGIDVVILERNFMGVCPFDITGLGLSWLDFSKVGSVHLLEKKPGKTPKYIKRTAKREGHVFSSIVPYKKSDNDETKGNENLHVTVCYNFLTPPKSYKKMLHNRYCSNSWAHEGPDFGYYRRKERMRIICMDMEYEMLNFENVCSEFNWEEDKVEDITKSTRYYDLTEHFIDKFVFVKRPKKYGY